MVHELVDVLLLVAELLLEGGQPKGMVREAGDMEHRTDFWSSCCLMNWSSLAFSRLEKASLIEALAKLCDVWSCWRALVPLSTTTSNVAFGEDSEGGGEGANAAKD